MIFEKKDIQNGDYGLFERNFISFDKKQTILVKNYDTLIPWITPKTRESNGMLKLHYEIIDFYNFMAPTEEEDLLKKETIRYFKNLIKDNWPNWKVKTFGSFPNKIHLPDSDIDIVVISEESSNKFQELRILNKIANKLIEDQKLEFIKIIKAKVPIIRAIFKDTKINFDISTNRKN